MSIILTKRAYADFRRIRRRYSPFNPAGQRWAVLGSDVLFKALDLAGVQPLDLLDKMARSGDRAELDTHSPLFARLIPQLPSCLWIIIEGGVVKIRCGGSITYTEHDSRAELIVFDRHLPETVIVAAHGRRLSEVLDITSYPALAGLDPIIKRARNAEHAATGTERCVILDLAVGWRSFAPAPQGIELRELAEQFELCMSPPSKSSMEPRR